MAVALLDAEGTWDEISARLGDWRNRRLRVIVLPADDRENPELDTRPIAEVLADIASSIPDRELASLPSDFADQLDHHIC